MKTAAWIHCLRCHENYHRDDFVLHSFTLCPRKNDQTLPANLQVLCLCLMPDFDFVPERASLAW